MKGLGNDIIEIARIEKSIKEYGPRFLDRLFTKKEQTYCEKHRQSARHYAGRFAAKEAIAKALNCGFGEKLAWLDLEILPSKSGKPELHYTETFRKAFGDARILLSISHCETYATAIAIYT